MRLLSFFVLGLWTPLVFAQPHSGRRYFLPCAPEQAEPDLPAPPPPRSIEGAIRKFVDDAEHGHFLATQDEIYGARHGLFGANEWSRKFVAGNPFEIKIQSISPPQINGSTPSRKLVCILMGRDFCQRPDRDGVIQTK